MFPPFKPALDAYLVTHWSSLHLVHFSYKWKALREWAPLILTCKRELPASASTYGNSFTLTALERAEKLSVTVQKEDTRPRFSAFPRHGDPCLWSWGGQEDRTGWRAVPFNKEKASMLEPGIPSLVRTAVFSVRKPASWDVPMSYPLLSFAFGSGSLFPSHVGGSAAANQTRWG